MTDKFKGGPTAKRATPVVNAGALASMGGGEFRGGPSKDKPGDSGNAAPAMATHGGADKFRGGQTPDVGHSRAEGDRHSVGDPKGTGQKKGMTPPRGPKVPPKRKPPSANQIRASRRAPPPGRDPDHEYRGPGPTADPAPPEPSAGAADASKQGGGDQTSPGGMELPADAAKGGPGSPDDPRGKEVFDLVVARTLDAVSKQSQDLDTALKADPLKATVGFGTAALHAVAQAADDAGKPIPFEILIQAGMQVIKVLGSVALEKGYLPEDQIEVFLKEALQQSLAKYTQLDQQAGKIKPEEMQQMQQKLGEMGGAPAAPQPGPSPAPPPGGPGALATQGGM